MPETIGPRQSHDTDKMENVFAEMAKARGMSWCRYKDESTVVQKAQLHIEGDQWMEGGTELLGEIHAELGTLRLGRVAVRKAVERLTKKMKKRGSSPIRTPRITSIPSQSALSICAVSLPRR